MLKELQRENEIKLKGESEIGWPVTRLRKNLVWCLQVGPTQSKLSERKKKGKLD